MDAASLPLALAEWPPFWRGLVSSLFAGAFLTGLGAMPVFFLRHVRSVVQNAMLAFAAGIMLAATFFSLLLPALEAAQAGIGNRYGAVSAVILALLIGASVMHLAHRITPHEHFLKGPENADHSRLARIWLFVMAISLHNLPEGLAVGVAGASPDLGAGLGVTLGIGLQNMPEGLAVALALRGEGYSRKASFMTAFASGVLEPLGGALGAGAVVISTALLPWALAFAAGAMLFIISSEVIPETHRNGGEGGATRALFGGFVVMLFLDVALG